MAVRNKKYGPGFGLAGDNRIFGHYQRWINVIGDKGYPHSVIYIIFAFCHRIRACTFGSEIKHGNPVM